MTTETAPTFAHTVTVNGYGWNRYSVLSRNEVKREHMRPTFGKPKCEVVNSRGETAPVWAQRIPNTEDRYLVTWPMRRGGDGAFSELSVIQAEIRTEDGLVGFVHLAEQLTGLRTR